MRCFRTHEPAGAGNSRKQHTGNVPVLKAAKENPCAKRKGLGITPDSLILWQMFRVSHWSAPGYKILALPVFLIIILSACHKTESGETLARKHCASCHRFPDPALLDKKRWETGVFPEMALRMGRDLAKLPGAGPDELHEILHAIPPAPLVTDDEWEAIKTYYLEAAADSLRETVVDKKLPLRQFSVSQIRLPISGASMLTMLRVNPNTGDIYIGTRNKKLFVLDPSFTPLDSFHLEGPPSDVVFTKKSTLVLSMGLMDPNDQFRGSVLQLPESGNAVELLIDSLKRPVDIVRADLNQDGAEDLLVSAFGNFTGALLAFEKTDSAFRRHVIHNFPGNRKAIVRDFNADGLPDILALISQGNEQIALFTNRGDFRFSYQILVPLPPVYGSSYMELVDFNGDPYPDILYTNGDNADYSVGLKPYHGVRLFVNDGKNHFREKWFYPMHGASMAHAHDYDQDGDMDIAAIAFFPDFDKHAEHSFVYLENNNGVFQGFYTPLASTSRWLVMESSDIDGDGDEDLMLGSLRFPATVPEDLFQSWGRDQTSLLVLKNNRVR